MDLPSTQRDSPSPLILVITFMGYDDGYYALKRCSTKCYIQSERRTSFLYGTPLEYSIYLGPKARNHITTIGPKYILYSYMDPVGNKQPLFSRMPRSHSVPIVPLKLIEYGVYGDLIIIYPEPYELLSKLLAYP